MNDENFERKSQKDECTGMDESGMKVIEKIVEDEDHGPTKEGEPFGLYHYPFTLDINKSSMGKTVYLLMTVPI
jgi:hypothetical protein